MAASCDEPVVVDGSRTEYAQVVAQPDGRMRFEAGVVPQRARKAGRWADVKLALERGGDGLWRPAASVADMAFSNGGSGPLVTLKRDGRTVTMSWPGTLRPPTVSGDSATYPEVMPDVDLVVRATATGFTHALVIKTAAAAAQQGVREVRFTLGGDTQIRPVSGGLVAMAGSSVVASTEPAAMWDSRTTTASATPEAKRLRASATSALDPVSGSTPSGAGDAARVAPVDVALSGKDLVLRPDSALLGAKDAAFPMFVDPAWSVSENKWAYATNNGSSNTDYSSARVGLNPDTGALYRSFFQFSTTANNVSLRGKFIQSARVEMNLDHSWSCDKTVTSMYATPAIDATMKANWSKMGLQQFLDDASGHANEAGGCGPAQADTKMQFQSDAVRNFMRSAADAGSAAVTVGFTARASDGSGESTQNRWKKFYPKDAKLFVDYDSRPGAPTSLKVATVPCPGSGVLTVGTLTPNFSAAFPDADRDDSLTGAFEWIEVPAAGLGAVTDSWPGRQQAPPAKTNVTPGALATTATVSVSKDRTYAFRARGTDKAPYSLTGSWSPWCQFKVDTSVPAVTARMVSVPAGPGRPGRVRIESTDSDVTTFQYGWDAATKQVAAQGSNPKYAEVDITAPRFGTNVLLLKAIDATLNEGNGSIEFYVARPAGPIARWGMETYPGISESAALIDEAATPVDSPLIPSNMTWAPDVHLLAGNTASFNGNSAQATTAAVVNTAGSFSVAAWVRLSDVPTTDVTFATQDGSDAAGFEIGVRHAGGSSTSSWSFAMHDTAAQSSTTRTATAGTPITSADADRWTHVAGVYDATEQKLSLYVDGTRVAQTDRPTGGWQASGTFAVGRGYASGSAANWWKGQLFDVEAFDRVLVPQDFTGQLASDPTSGGFDEPGFLSPIPVGDWNFASAVRCRTADLRDTCKAPDWTAFNRTLALTRGADVGAGRSTNNPGLWLDDKYFPANDGSFTESTHEYGRSATETGLTPPDDDGNEFTTWQDKPVMRTDQSFTISVWAMLDTLDGGGRTVIAQTGAHESAFWLKYFPGNGKWQFITSAQDDPNTQMWGVDSKSAAQAGRWTHLTGVYDAGRHQLRLYVNGTLENTSNLPFTPMTASGPLLVGQTMWHSERMDQWSGAIDDVTVFQGAMTDGAVSAWYDRQAADLSGANVLGAGQQLNEDQVLQSDNGAYQLWMQNDGNFVLYRDGAAVWSSNTWGNPGAHVIMQPDGNLVIYRSDGVAIWATNTERTAANRLVLYDNGDLLLLDPSGQVIWRARKTG
ncbi:LamG-like jellyroll fold domain-containing protein [Krasilnikovia sp. MM14-A1259]|uniref:LamG-like jellyroll fold domain-containing protein n=1 Tax=Krasilnikovia sp. MM14-A1259 TaxID=3373539 RepID=UPI0037F54256